MDLPTSPATVTPSIPNPTILNAGVGDSEKKPRMISWISGLLFVIGFSYTAAAITFVAVNYIFNRGMGGATGFDFLKFLPTMGIPPLYFAPIGLLFFS